MRHRVAHRKLGRVTEHRLATLRNLSQMLLRHERIDTTLGMLGEHYRHQRQVPGVLGVVLASLVAGEQGLAQDVLELVDLDDESKLAGESVGPHLAACAAAVNAAC